MAKKKASRQKKMQTRVDASYHVLHALYIFG